MVLLVYPTSSGQYLQGDHKFLSKYYLSIFHECNIILSCYGLFLFNTFHRKNNNNNNYRHVIIYDFCSLSLSPSSGKNRKGNKRRDAAKCNNMTLTELTESKNFQSTCHNSIKIQRVLWCLIYVKNVICSSFHVIIAVNQHSNFRELLHVLRRPANYKQHVRRRFIIGYPLAYCISLKKQMFTTRAGLKSIYKIPLKL